MAQKVADDRLFVLVDVHVVHPADDGEELLKVDRDAGGKLQKVLKLDPLVLGLELAGEGLVAQLQRRQESDKRSGG